MKKILSMLMIAIMLFTITPTQTANAAVKLSKSKATMEVSSTLTLNIKGTSSKITWNSSKSDVATVSSKGVITAKKPGTSTISAMVSKKQYSCVVTVINSDQEEVIAKKGTITELTTGSYLIGEDFPAGKYNVVALSGAGNFHVSGNDTSVIEILADESNETFDTHTYSNLRLLYGDEMKITNGVILEFTKLD